MNLRKRKTLLSTIIFGLLFSTLGISILNGLEHNSEPIQEAVPLSYSQELISCTVTANIETPHNNSEFEYGSPITLKALYNTNCTEASIQYNWYLDFGTNTNIVNNSETYEVPILDPGFHEVKLEVIINGEVNAEKFLQLNILPKEIVVKQNNDYIPPIDTTVKDQQIPFINISVPSIPGGLILGKDYGLNGDGGLGFNVLAALVMENQDSIQWFIESANIPKTQFATGNYVRNAHFAFPPIGACADSSFTITARVIGSNGMVGEDKITESGFNDDCSGYILNY